MKNDIYRSKSAKNKGQPLPADYKPKHGEPAWRENESGGLDPVIFCLKDRSDRLEPWKRGWLCEQEYRDQKKNLKIVNERFNTNHPAIISDIARIKRGKFTRREKKAAADISLYFVRRFGSISG